MRFLNSSVWWRKSASESFSIAGSSALIGPKYASLMRFSSRSLWVPKTLVRTALIMGST